ncbi:MAG: SDR family NAD(P)-dependent oxidoreductase [Actinomycetota bacterium]|nr:SDR family NAD(P)-dependent oxidoreductase [Actinomycetota bacterium]
MTARTPNGELRFDGRVAMITGAGAGLGRSHAMLLAARGAHVVVNDLHADAADAVVAEITAAGGSAAAHAADISQPDGASGLVQTALDAWGRVDIVINNAGLLQPTDFADMTPEIFDRAYAVNLRASFLVTHAAWKPMVAQGYGRVVHTSSNSGLLGIAGSTGYASAKAGLWGFTRSLSLEASPLGIHVNAIGPIAYTAMSRTSRVAPATWKSGEGDAWSRRLDAALVSPAVAWLAHEDCTLNGQVLSVAAGRVARFVIGLNHGFVRDALTVEDVRDHDELLQTEAPDEFPATANEESIALHRRVMPRPDPGRRLDK